MLMKHFLNRPDIYNQPIRLTNEDPQEVIENFFLDFHLSDVRQELWNMLEAAITTDHPNYSKAEAGIGYCTSIFNWNN
jgi:hypothetical protein